MIYSIFNISSFRSLIYFYIFCSFQYNQNILNHKEDQIMITTLQSTFNKCYYLIQLLKSNYISIQIDDFKARRRNKVLIDNSMLHGFSMNVRQLYQLLYKQFIHENKVIRRMIRCEDNLVHISFDFPHSTIQNIRFQSQAIDLSETSQMIEMIQRLTNQKIQEFKTLFQSQEKRILNQLQFKLQQSLIKLSLRLQEWLQRMNETITQKLESFEQAVDDRQKQNKDNNKKHLEESVSTLKQQNIKMMKEMSVVVGKLQDQIDTINHNIITSYERTKDLELLIDEHKNYLQDQLLEIKEMQQSFTIKIQQIIEAIYTRPKDTENQKKRYHFYQSQENQMKVEDVLLQKDLIDEKYMQNYKKYQVTINFDKDKEPFKDDHINLI